MPVDVEDPRLADVRIPGLRLNEALMIQVALRVRLDDLAALGPAFEKSRAIAERTLAIVDEALYPEAPVGGIEQYQSEGR